MASIDVVIPCRNHVRFLPECVRSVLTQDVDGLGVTIIVDKASTDDSVAVAMELAECDTSIGFVCGESIRGINEAIDRSEADYFMVLPCNHILTADALFHGVNMLETFPRISCVLGTYMEPWAGTVLPDLMRQPGGGELMEGTTFIEMSCAVAGQNVPAYAMIVRTSVQKRVGHYQAVLPVMGDLEMALRLASKGLVAQLRGPLTVGRMGTPGHTGRGTRIDDLAEREAAFNSFFSHEGRDIPGAEKMHRSAKRHLAGMAFWPAVSRVATGRVREGFHVFRYGLSLSPASMLLPFRNLSGTNEALKRATAAISQAFGRE